MDKPVAAIERMRKWNDDGESWPWHRPDATAILAYLDSIPDGAVPVVWPKELTRERLEELATYKFYDQANALRALAAIAPVRKRRVGNIYNINEMFIWVREGEPIGLDWKPLARNVELED